jgi:hypothetical protein
MRRIATKRCFNALFQQIPRNLADEPTASGVRAMLPTFCKRQVIITLTQIQAVW